MANSMLEEAKKKGKVFRSADGKKGIRYRDGKFQTLCESCKTEKWNTVVESHALKVAVQIKEQKQYPQS